MARFQFALLTTILACPMPLFAQTRIPPQSNPTELVRSWYRQFLHREMDRGAVQWINELTRGTAPDLVMVRILASGEYYTRAGSTPEGFVRELFDDLRGRDPTRAELREWTRRLETQNRNDVALLLIRGDGGPQPPPNPGDAEYFDQLRDAIRRLDDKLEDLAEDIISELEGQLERDLHRKAEAVQDDLHAFRRVVRPGIPRERTERTFNQLDRNLDDLLQAVRRQAGDRRVLLRSADRVAQVDQRLHLAFYANQEPPARPGRDLARETDALLAQAKQLQRTAGFVVADAGSGIRIKRNLDQFVDRTERFQRTLRDGADLDRLRRDFMAMTEPWSVAVRDINTLPPAGGYGILRLQAQRVEQIGVWIQKQLGAKVDIPYLSTTTAPGR